MGVEVRPFGGRDRQDKPPRVSRISVGGDLGKSLAEQVLVIMRKHGIEINPVY